MQFTIFDADSNKSSKWYIFKNTTELGAIYQTIPWDKLASLIPEKATAKGAPSWLPKQGYFGLMFLKHYLGLSDEKLLSHFQTDWAMQLFCGVLLAENERIRDNAFVSNVRSFLGKHLNLEQFQWSMIDNWKNDDMENLHLTMMDATCFESYVRYPTDVKLLWECVERLWDVLIPDLCKAFKIAMPRSKYAKQKEKYLHYSKLRKRSRKKTNARKKALLHLLNKGIESYQELLNQTKGGKLSSKIYQLFATIKKIYQQQWALFTNPKSHVSDRIVSLHKPYLRPIVRGKENKPVEFGMKVHICQTDGINWIEHASFSAFNECKRLKISVLKHNINISTCQQLAADRIYPTNENRRFITQRGIKTNFEQKGHKKLSKEEKAHKALLNKGRNTHLEGSFGNEKNHYSLRKIKAQNQQTEMVWMYFGVMTANAVSIARRRERKAREKEQIPKAA